MIDTTTRVKIRLSYTDRCALYQYKIANIMSIFPYTLFYICVLGRDRCIYNNNYTAYKHIMMTYDVITKTHLHQNVVTLEN